MYHYYRKTDLIDINDVCNYADVTYIYAASIYICHVKNIAHAKVSTKHTPNIHWL